MSDFDVMVIGGGAAGLSAALVLARARRSVTVVEAGAPRNAPAAHLQGFLSRDGVPPLDLLAAGRAEVAGYGGRFVSGAATSITHSGNGDFTVSLETGLCLSARRVLVTTGLRDQLPDIPGLAERWGKDVLHCPYCHGYEVRDQPIAVIGGSATAVQHALLVRQWSHDVVLLSHDDTLTADAREQLVARAIGVVDGRIARLAVEGDRLVGVELADGRVVPRAAVFVRPTFLPNDALLAALGCATDPSGWTLVDPGGRTSVAGIWAAGNATNPRAQVITAAGEGSAAAISINGDLVDDDVRTAVRDFRGGLLP